MDRKPDDNGKRDPAWQMPEWMERYRPLMDMSLGGNSVERCMNLTGDQTWGNSILAAICYTAEGPPDENYERTLRRIYNEWKAAQS